MWEYIKDVNIYNKTQISVKVNASTLIIII